MCGICGKLDQNGVSVEEMRRMAASIAHRGPDDEGFYVQGPIGLACRRLSIIDPEGGHQPISNEKRSAWIVFNGEIYNYKVLRKELEGLGHEFATHSDTEVILHLYEEMGEQCVQKLRGMFAFAIWDETEEKLFLARDRLGQKPLFYAFKNGQFLFGSEVKAILAGDGSLCDLDFESLHHYLSLRFIPVPRTMFRSIRKVPAAHTLVFRDGSVRLHRYWQLSFQNKLNLPEDELLAGLEEHLERTVTAHLVSDVPVGAFLSGGMDSSMIVALMAKEIHSGFRTFAIGVDDDSFNELPYARLVADSCGTEHEEEIVSADLVARLPATIGFLDEPSDPIATCMYQAAALASRYVKVTLGGDGGDELFGGFDRYLGVRHVEDYSNLAALVGRRLIHPLLSVVPESFAYKSWTQKLRWLERVSAASGPGERYAEATIFFRFSHEQKSRLFTSDVWNELRSSDSADVISATFDDAPAEGLLDRMLYSDYVTRLPEHSLMLTDRMGMAHGLEIRSPFLDHELVEYLARFPMRLKIRNGRLKYGLRHLARGYLPRQIVRRGKQGFMFPTAQWLRQDLQELLRKFLLQGQTLNDGVFNRPFLEELLTEHSLKRVDHNVRLWMLLSFEIWYRIYMAGCNPAQLEAEISGLRVAAPGKTENNAPKES